MGKLGYRKITEFESSLQREPDELIPVLSLFSPINPTILQDCIHPENKNKAAGIKVLVAVRMDKVVYSISREDC